MDQLLKRVALSAGERARTRGVVDVPAVDAPGAAGMFKVDLDLPEAKEEANATTRTKGKAVVFPAFWSGNGNAAAAAKTEEGAGGEANTNTTASTKASAKAVLAAAAANDVSNPWVGGNSAADDLSTARAPAISTLDALAAKQQQEQRGKSMSAVNRGAGAGARGRAPQMEDDERHNLVAAMFAHGGADDAQKHFSKLKVRAFLCSLVSSSCFCSLIPTLFFVCFVLCLTAGDDDSGRNGGRGQLAGCEAKEGQYAERR